MIIENNVNFMLVDRCFYIVFVVSKLVVLLLNVNPQVKLVWYNRAHIFTTFLSTFFSFLLVESSRFDLILWNENAKIEKRSLDF